MGRYQILGGHLLHNSTKMYVVQHHISLKTGWASRTLVRHIFEDQLHVFICSKLHTIKIRENFKRQKMLWPKLLSKSSSTVLKITAIQVYWMRWIKLFRFLKFYRFQICMGLTLNRKFSLDIFKTYFWIYSNSILQNCRLQLRS